MNNHREHGRDLVAPQRLHSRASEDSWRTALLIAGLVVTVGLAAMYYLPRLGVLTPPQEQSASRETPEGTPVLSEEGAVAPAMLPQPRALSGLRQACVEEVRNKGSGHACREYEERTRSETDPDINVITFVPPPPVPAAPARRSRRYGPTRDWMYAVEHYCDVFPYGSIKYRNCRSRDASRWIKGKCRYFTTELESAQGEEWRQQLWADREAACSAVNRFNPVN